MENLTCRTEGMFAAQINQLNALNTNAVTAHYYEDVLTISRIDQSCEAKLSSLRIELASDIQSGTYELGVHPQFQAAEIITATFPVRYKTVKGSITLQEVDHAKHLYKGEAQITGEGLFGVDKSIEVAVQFSLMGAQRIMPTPQR